MQWHQLDHMQTICTSLQTDNHTNTSLLNFYEPDASPDAQHTVSKHWTNYFLVLQYFICYMQNNTLLTYRDFLRVDGSVLPSTKELLNSKGRRQTDFIPANQANQTHTHPCNGHFSGTMQVSQYQKSKTNLDFTEARDSELQWHQLDHMQVCTSLQRTRPAPHHSVFTGWMPFRPPNQQRQSIGGYHTK